MSIDELDEIMMNRIWKQRDDLLKENKRLEDHIRRLEEAGDEMEKYIFDQTNTRFIICAIQWREAKEAKP